MLCSGTDLALLFRQDMASKKGCRYLCALSCNSRGGCQRTASVPIHPLLSKMAQRSALPKRTFKYGCSTALPNKKYPGALNTLSALRALSLDKLQQFGESGVLMVLKSGYSSRTGVSLIVPLSPRDTFASSQLFVVHHGQSAFVDMMGVMMPTFALPHAIILYSIQLWSDSVQSTAKSTPACFIGSCSRMRAILWTPTQHRFN